MVMRVIFSFYAILVWFTRDGTIDLPYREEGYRYIDE